MANPKKEKSSPRTHEVVSPESIKSELEDYSAPILIQDLEFHLDLFSQRFLAKLASILQDMLLFQFGARTAALGKRVGERKAWDVAGEVYHTLGRQVFPVSPYVDKIDVLSLDFDDLTKPGLLKLIRTYGDQWIKVGMYWVGQVTQLCSPEMPAISEETYGAVARYEMPKLAELAGVSLDHVVGYVKVNQLSIDCTQGYRNVKEIINDDQINVSLYACDVWGKLRDQGVFNDQTALNMCEREAGLAAILHGAPQNTCVIPKMPGVGFKGVAPGEPICIMQFKRASPGA